MPRYSVTITQGAEGDLDDIYRTIAQQRGQDDADKWLDALEQAAASLEQFPNRGSVPQELRSLGSDKVRQLLLDPYRIVYEVDGINVNVLVIGHGKRDFQSLLQDRLLRP